ncbi:MAG: ABC transporter permease [Nitrospinales bacterium]
MTSFSTRQLFRFALAECRGAWRRFVFFIICLAIGVGAVMTVKTFSAVLKTTMERQARSLLAADIEIRSSWPQSPEDIAFQRRALPPGSEFLSIKEMKAMARYEAGGQGRGAAQRSSLLVELKSLPSSPPFYPMYGKLKTRPAAPLAELLADNGALVEPSFLLRTRLRLGDRFRLGGVRVRVAGEILAEPDRISRSFSIGPRVMVSSDTLAAAELVRPGSRVRHRTLIRLPASADLQQTAEALENGLADKTAAVRTYKDMQSSLTAAISQISRYLECVGVIALFMGGIGVAMIVRTFMAHKLDTIAVLNCLGATSRTVFGIYLLQALLLGVIGSCLGLALGFVLQYALPGRLEGLLNIAVTPEFHWAPAVQSLMLGLLTTLLFSVWPLVRAVKTRPLRLFRHLAEEETLKRGSRRERWAVGAGLGLGLVAIVFWQAGSLRQGAVFLMALAVSAAVLAGVSRLVLKTLRRFAPSKRMTLRYGVANLYRPNSQAPSIITALGMGIMLILTIRLVQLDVVVMLNGRTAVDPPNYFFIDIQPDQEKSFMAALDRVAPGAERTLTPLVRSRFYGVDGRTLDGWKFKSPRAERWLRREFVLTYAGGSLPRDNRIVAGKWWGEAGARRPQVSIEEDAARRWGASLGSVLTMDIQGVKVSAPVTSIRRVNWRNMRTNFYVIFSPAALAGAPVTSVATVRVPPEKEMAVQQAVVEAMPNVTAISTNDIIRTVENVIGKLTTLVDFMSAFSILAGLFILSGAVASTRFRRLKESAVLKTLGARRGTVAAILGYEYAGLGAIAAFIGVGLSLALSWAVMRYLVKAPWTPHLAPLAVVFALAVPLTSLTGILSSLDVLRNEPLQTLRQVDG